MRTPINGRSAGAVHAPLGIELARSLGVREGDKITAVTPGGQVTPAGIVPRLKQFTVAGTFEAGHYEYDRALALIHIDDAAKLMRVEGAICVQLKLSDAQLARDAAYRGLRPCRRPFVDGGPGGLGKGSQVLVVKADSRYKNVAELLAAARAKPCKLSFGSGSSSSRVGVASIVFAFALRCLLCRQQRANAVLRGLASVRNCIDQGNY